MFEDFKNAVLNSYSEKNKQNQLSDNLLNPTKAKLRTECLLVLKNRYLQKDDNVIKAFFDPDGKFDNHELSITKFDLEGFKALQKFFLGQSGIRKEENIKLLAWLIDFEPRPYTFEKNYDISEKSGLVLVNENLIDEPILNLSTTNSIFWKKTRVIVFLSILLGLLIISIFPRLKNARVQSLINTEFPLSSNEDRPVTSLINNSEKQCMYWIEDHYEPIRCSETKSGVMVIAMDEEKMARLRKITNLDTIGTKDIGKTWYFKIARDSIELYTDSGNYPLDNKRVLKPLTLYMLNKYILSNN